MEYPFEEKMLRNDSMFVGYHEPLITYSPVYGENLWPGVRGN